MASVLVALASHFALYSDAPLSQLHDWLTAKIHVRPDPWEGGPVQGPGVGMNTARAVLTLVSQEKSLLDIARRTIEWGGDTDSVLAIAWGIASARMTEDLPAFFDEGLENGPYGRDFLIGLGGKLVAKYGT